MRARSRGIPQGFSRSGRLSVAIFLTLLGWSVLTGAGLWLVRESAFDVVDVLEAIRWSALLLFAWPAAWISLNVARTPLLERPDAVSIGLGLFVLLGVCLPLLVGPLTAVGVHFLAGHWPF